MATAFTAVVVAVVVGLQRDALVPPGVEFLVAMGAAAPFVVDAIARVWVPRAAMAGVVILAELYLLTDPVDIDVAPFLLVLLAGQTAALAPFRLGIVVALASASVGIVLEATNIYNGWFVWMIGIGFGWAFGRSTQRQLRLLDELLAAQADLREQGAADERRRIAREIHDVVAHSLTVTMLHVTAARLAVDDDPAEARDALLEAERTGRTALADIRRTVGLLSESSARGTAAPLPGASAIRDLATQFCAAGVRVTVDITGDLESVPPATGLAIYRIAQESLANAAKHAQGAACDLRLGVSAEEIRLTVRNPVGQMPASEGRGHGLDGSRERVSLLGGTFRAGRAGDDWVVEAVVPAQGAIA